MTDDGAAECLGAVATGAVGAEAAAVDVLGLVAGIAIRRQFGAGGIFGLVARIATHSGMGPGEGIARVPAVIKVDALPSQRTVAIVAGLRKAALMNVLLAVACITRGWRTFISAGFVATFAGHQNMKASERIGGEPVIELHILVPGHHTVTLATAFTQLGLMYVLLLVARNTLHRQLGLDVGAMAVTTLSLGMCAFERKVRLAAMVELRVFPLFNAVTVFAFHAELARMHIIDGMAIIAGHRHTGIDFPGMAGDALRLGVRAAQLELGLVVIKRFGFFPIIDHVAILAVLAEVAFVRLRFAVAIVAAMRRFAEFLAFLVA